MLGNRDIAALQVGWAAGIAADWAIVVGFLVVAYAEAGAFGAGLVGLARMLPSTATALFVPTAGRLRDERLLLAVNVIRAVAAAAAAILLVAGASGLAVVLVAGAVIGGVGSLVRPTHMALTPGLAATPEELVASNVASTTGEAAATLAGPLVAGILLQVSGPAVVTLAATLTFAVAAFADLRIHVPVAARAGVGRRSGPPLVLGVRTLAERPAVATLVGALFAQTIVRGLLTTLIVVVSIELLGLGEPGVGLLNAAVGAGGILGSLAALTRPDRRRLAPGVGTSLVGWGAPIAVIGIVPSVIVAPIGLGIVGLSNALLDVAAFTLLQRTVPMDRRGSVLAVLEGLVGLGVAAGGILAPVLVELFGIRVALVLTGVLLPLIAVVTWPAVRRLDDASVVPEREARLLRSCPLFALLPLDALELVATSAVSERVTDGTVVIREGEAGDGYYVIAEGRAEASVNGRHLRTMGPGEGFGEIALLRHVPRTATVVAVGPLETYVVRRDVFLAAVAGHAASKETADAVARERIGATPS